jgi:hypothetical protein
VWKDGGSYDAVTCMFALHYFFQGEESARNAIEMAAVKLKEGGYFFGVLPDGKNVQDTIGPAMKPLSLKAMKLAPRWKGQATPFGSPYTCALTDTVTEVLIIQFQYSIWYSFVCLQLGLPYICTDSIDKRCHQISLLANLHQAESTDIVSERTRNF